jgi:hypothetical protein
MAMTLQQATIGAPVRGLSAVPSLTCPTSFQRARLTANGADHPVDVHLADTTGRRDDTRLLVNRRYAWRGYGDQHVLPSHRGCATFAASALSKVLGTVTLVIDSPAKLGADQAFADIIDPYRAVAGRKICELGRLAFESSLPSKPFLAALFHIVFLYGFHHHRCSDLFIEVHPRHRRFYTAMLGFAPVGPVRINHTVNAPAQLMWLDIATIRQRIQESRWDRLGGSSRSLYALFFEDEEEAVLAKTLTSDCPPDTGFGSGPTVRIFIPD